MSAHSNSFERCIHMQEHYKINQIGSFGAIGALMMLMNGCGNKASTAPPASPPPEVGIVVVQPQRVVLSTELPGRTAPFQIAEVRPQVNGIVQKRIFIEGSDVKAGAGLYQIDPATYQAGF